MRGFSEGTFSTSTTRRPNSPSTVTRCWFRSWPGTAKILIRVFSGPTLARETAATTLTLSALELLAKP